VQQLRVGARLVPLPQAAHVPHGHAQGLSCRQRVRVDGHRRVAPADGGAGGRDAFRRPLLAAISQPLLAGAISRPLVATATPGAGLADSTPSPDLAGFTPPLLGAVGAAQPIGAA
jgi:hypothetical protein